MTNFTNNNIVWLVDATTYTKSLDSRLKGMKQVFYSLKSLAKKCKELDTVLYSDKTFSAGLLRIATILDSNGYEVYYVHIEKAIEALLNDTYPMPNIVAFSAVCPTVDLCSEFTNFIKNINPNVKAVIGGPQAFVAPNTLKKRYKAFDDVISESDCNAASRVVGRVVTYDQGGNFLNYRLLPDNINKYCLNIATYLGCEYSCGFCIEPLMPKQIMPLDGGITSFLSELVPNKLIHVCDTSLGGSYFRALRVLEEMRMINHNKFLSCDLRYDFIDENTIIGLKKAGFVEVNIGIDSYNSSISGKATFAEMTRRLQMIRKYSNLYVSVYLVSGLPGYDHEQFILNKDMISILYGERLVDQIKHHIYVPYPTDHNHKYNSKVIIATDDWTKYDRQSFPVYRLQTMDSDEIWEWYLEIERHINDKWRESLGKTKEEIQAEPTHIDYNLAYYK